jgi:hypothetical protein
MPKMTDLDRQEQQNSGATLTDYLLIGGFIVTACTALNNVPDTIIRFILGVLAALTR